MTCDLRIYYGNARITLPADDPRVARILALVVNEAQPTASAVALRQPESDAEFLAMARAYFARKG